MNYPQICILFIPDQPLMTFPTQGRSSLPLLDRNMKINRNYLDCDRVPASVYSNQEFQAP